MVIRLSKLYRLFAWRVVKHVKSNAIAITKDRALRGVTAIIQPGGSVKDAETIAPAKCNGYQLNLEPSHFKQRDNLPFPNLRQ